jgi:hypothetical protein
MRRNRGKMAKISAVMICIAMIWLMGADFSWAPNASGQSIFQSYTKPQVAPDFSLPDLQGKQVNIRDHRGQPILLNFWATW